MSKTLSLFAWETGSVRAPLDGLAPILGGCNGESWASQTGGLVQALHVEFRPVRIARYALLLVRPFAIVLSYSFISAEHEVKSEKNQGPLFLGVDLGGSNLRMALVGAGGKIWARARWKTAQDRSVEGVLDAIVSLATQLRCEAEMHGRAVVAMGVGVPGLVEPEVGSVETSPNFPGWRHVALRSDLEARLGIPVNVENDVNSIAVGELNFGVGRGARDILVVTLGTGVGGGLILGGELRRGPDGTAGEIGHVTVVPRGRPCGCGNRGCLESYASATAIAKRAVESGLLTEGDATAERVSSLARCGDEKALRIFDKAGECIGVVLAGVANLLNLEVVVLGGGVSRSWDLMRSSARREIDKRAFSPPARRLKVVASRLLDDAGVLGAVCLARKGVEDLGS